MRVNRYGRNLGVNAHLVVAHLLLACGLISARAHERYWRELTFHFHHIVPHRIASYRGANAHAIGQICFGSWSCEIIVMSARQGRKAHVDDDHDHDGDAGDLRFITAV
jgi:hypothetical protein